MIPTLQFRTISSTCSHIGISHLLDKSIFEIFSGIFCLISSIDTLKLPAVEKCLEADKVLLEHYETLLEDSFKKENSNL